MVVAATAPFATVKLPRIDSFIPAHLAIIFVSDLVTAILLLHQSSLIGSRALLVLASGYLFSALIVVPQALTFPGVFAPHGLLGAGVQSSAWLNVFGNSGFATAVAGYACLKGGSRRKEARLPLARPAIYGSVTGVVGVVCALTWGVTAGHNFMPRLFLDDLRLAPLAPYVTGAVVAMCVLALLLMYVRRRSVLDLWVMVTTSMLFAQMALTTFALVSRFTLGYYVNRGLAVAVSAVVLIALLSALMRQQAALSDANMRLEQERENKLMSLEAMTASISHELRQPLAAIAANGGAALRFLKRAPPDLEEVRSALDSMVVTSHRASRIFDNLDAMFGRTNQRQEPVDVNEVIVAALRALRGELDVHGVTTRTELTSELPLVMGHSGQLQQVVLNLLRNGIQAMDAIKGRDRVLRVKTEHNGRDAITVAVEDTGTGIDPDKLDSIFEAFVTTKPQGTGLGLAICRRIIDIHGGQLTASSNGNCGALFQFVLPIKLAAGSSTPGASLAG